jgi:phage/plasmid-like protein (TIGR03299 family)
MLQDGRKTWILARLPQRYQMQGDWIEPFMVFYNSHDGSGSIKVALTPIRVTCQNTLNLALRTAKRVWSTKHTGDIHFRMDDAKETLFRAEQYMEELNGEFNHLAAISFNDREVERFIQELIPVPKNASSQQERNVARLRNDLSDRYHKAPDLAHLQGNGYKLINAVSDFATHAEPLRKTDSYQENLFAKTLDGNPLMDKAHRMILQAA